MNNFVSIAIVCCCLSVATAVRAADSKPSGLCQKSIKPSPKPAYGAYKPQCHQNGDFKPMQCNFATNYCWCVVPVTGQRVSTVKPFKLSAVNEEEVGVVVDCAKEAEAFANAKRPCVPATPPPDGHRRKGACYPKCTPDGKFEATQCCSTGYCTCVDPETGINTTAPFRLWQSDIVCTTAEPLTQTPVDTDTPPCMPPNKKALPGQFVPQCTADGLFQPRQCHGSSGYCWCVDKHTGQPTGGDKFRPWQNHTTCQEELAAGDNDKLCLAQREKAVKMLPLTGKFVPQCTDNGLFNRTQCLASSGYCWCVNEQSGKPVSKEFGWWMNDERIDCEKLAQDV